MATAEKVYIIGIGENGLDGLTTAARRLIEGAELLIGEGHTLALVPELGAERLVVGTSFDEALERIDASPAKRVVVLATGDPLFYGVARYLCDKLGKQRFEVVPHVSSMQLAFARVKESWEEAFLTNLATHGLESVLEQIRTAEKVGLFTSEACPPSTVARSLLQCQIDYFTAYVCENLNAPDERVTQGELSEIAEQEFAALNVMILVRKPNVPDRPAEAIGRRLFGNPEAAFHQSKPKWELVTPAEIRSIALAELDLGPASVVWDIGAGSGSVSIEAAQIAHDGRVFAIEQSVEDHQLIMDNARRFGVTNVVPVLGRAPEVFVDLAEPDAVFVDGSGRDIGNLVDAAYQRLRGGGRLVAAMASIDNVAETHRLLRGYSADAKVWMVHVARGTYQMERVRFDSLNPTFLVAVVKPG
ncbi:MAG: precorrin-6Y C5,15-methyltransferase [Planctomycetes bacterium RBG_13_63_9]|nr:MAG: precorrin-6Y C5,15-methyltransferase [Planctomycetes bacterium RBG_13_63_9]